MAKKSKTRTDKPAATPARKPNSAKQAAPVLKAGRKKRAAGGLTLSLPLARARKLAGDLYEVAGLNLWAEALDAAEPSRREELVQLQDAVCDAGDLLKLARLSNPKHLQLFMVACYDRDGLPATPPRFVTAANAEDALTIWKAEYKGKYGRRKPRVESVPERGDKAELHS